MITQSAAGMALERSLDILWQRHQVVMHNIANEDTPGFKAKRLEFAGMLQREISAQARTSTSAFGQRGSALNRGQMRAIEVEDNRHIGRADGNNVDIDSEFIEQARIQLHWNLAIQRAGSRYNTLKYAITGGR